MSKNRTFKINLDANSVQCLSTINIEEESWLWHYKYGHLNFKSLNKLNIKNGMWLSTRILLIKNM